MGPQFHETRQGLVFFEVQLPRLIKALERIACAAEKREKEKEKEHTHCFDLNCEIPIGGKQ